jgi:GNAT superfamily N-acetyltransferase
MEIAARLSRRTDRREVFVAVDRSNVLGWIAISVDEPFVAGRGALIEGFIVDENRRSQNAGRQLLDAAVTWSRARECAEF